MSVTDTSTPRAPERDRRFWWIGGGLVLAVAVVVSAFASGLPDGLEWTAEALGFSDTAVDSAVAENPLADYGVAGLDNAFLSNGLAGLVGLAVVLLVTWVLTRALRPGRRP